jgi:4'-phosphopantetheinyl transferase
MNGRIRPETAGPRPPAERLRVARHNSAIRPQAGAEPLEIAARQGLDRPDVHVWHVRIPREMPSETVRAVLSMDERARSARYVRPEDRLRYEASHLALRHVLAAYAGVEPAALRFARGNRGKPSLADFTQLRFSLSHARTHALVAVSIDRELGVDIEEHHELDPMAVAAGCFSQVEMQALQSITPHERVQAFFDAWTCKEAWVKARGDGLYQQLKDFDVSVGAGPAALLATRPEPREKDRWSLVRLDIAAGHSAALACAGTAATVTIFELARRVTGLDADPDLA